MATKPATLPRPWATNAVYATGPFAGQPGKVDPGIGVAAEGHRPGANDPTAAEHENYQQNLVTASWLPWVNSGSSAGAADAHIVETAASGRAVLHGLTVTDLVNETAVTVSGATTVAPAMAVTNTGTGPVLAVTANAATASDAFYVTMTGAMSGAGISVDATATSTGPCVDIAVPAGSSSFAFRALSESSTATAQIRNADIGNALDVIATSGYGVNVSVSAGAYGVIVDGGNTYSLFAEATGNGTGVGGFSGPTAGAIGTIGVCQNDDGFGVYGTTPGTSSTTARAGYFSAGGSAVGVEARATGNAALLLTPDTTAPVYGAIKQSAATNAIPTDFTTGQLGYVGSTFDAWMHSSFADSSWRAMWSTLGGFCYGSHMAQLVTNNDHLTYTTLCTVNLSSPNAPRLAGQKVRITFSGRGGALTTGTAGYIDVRLRDSTAVVNILTRAGSGISSTSGYYFPNAAGTMEREISIDVEYTIPIAGARTFILEVKKNVALTNQITVQGSLVVTGMYS